MLKNIPFNINFFAIKKLKVNLMIYFSFYTTFIISAWESKLLTKSTKFYQFKSHIQQRQINVLKKLGMEFLLQST